MNLETKIGILSIITSIILWSINRFFPQKQKYSKEELEEMFKEYNSINVNQPEIKGDGNNITIINNNNG